MIPFTFPTYVQGDGTIACRAKVITDTTGLVRWIDYTPIKFVASMTNMGTTNNDGSQAIELITQTTGLVKGIDYIVVYVDSSATVPWSTNANGYIPCYSAPYSLFATSEQGVWYDPSDFSTLFQDSAGTTPVTAVEQPVGLMLDKSKGLVLGPELVTNGGFASATGWTTSSNWVISGGVATFTPATASNDTLTQTLSITTGKSYVVTYTVTRLTGSFQIYLANGGAGIVRSTSGTFQEVITCGTLAPTLFLFALAGFTGSVDNISVKELPGNHATQATAASRPILKQDGNGKYYLLFDGVDDSMATGSIDFTATDKMTVFAGVRKLSDATNGIVCELSATTGTNAGTFRFTIPGTPPSPNYESVVKGTGTEIPATITGFAAPNTAVISFAQAISTGQTIRANGGAATGASLGSGTGNYGNYPLFIGRRNNTNVPFNGHLYSLIVRGAQSSDAQITSAETYVNGKTGAWG